MDAFRNYDSLLNDINEGTRNQNSKLAELTDRKIKTDEITKTLGEAKLFLSGKSLGEKVGKVLKPKIQKGLNDAGNFVKGKLEETGAAIKTKINQALTGPEREGTGPTRMENLQNQIADRERARASARRVQDEADGQDRRGVGPNQSGDLEEGTELQNIRGGGGTTVSNPAFDPEASGDVDLLESSQTMAQTGGVQANAIDNTLAQARGQTFQSPMANQRANKFAPDQEDGQSSSTPRSAPPDNTVEPPEPGGGQSASIEKKVVGKEEEEETGDLAADETGAGILDAIPGLDVLGIIGGAVMAGVSAHKAKVAGQIEKAKTLDPSLQLGSTYQAGLGMDF